MMPLANVVHEQLQPNRAQTELMQIPLGCHLNTLVTKERYSESSCTAPCYEAAVLAAHQALGMVTEFGDSHDR